MLIISCIFKSFHDFAVQYSHSSGINKTTHSLVGIGNFALGSILAVLLCGIVSDKVINGKCFLIIIALNCLTIIYDFIRIFFENITNPVAVHINEFFIGFLSSGTSFMFQIICPLFIVNPFNVISLV